MEDTLDILCEEDNVLALAGFVGHFTECNIGHQHTRHKEEAVVTKWRAQNCLVREPRYDILGDVDRIAVKEDGPEVCVAQDDPQEA